jgi:serine/threonine protein kinase
LAEILRTLAYLNSKRIVHRDLKLQNVMLSGSNLNSGIKLIDFGLAEQLSTSNFAPGKVGTVGYFAPEVIRNRS